MTDKQKDELRKIRGVKKSALTRACNGVPQLLLEMVDKEEIMDRFKTLKHKFGELEAAHDEYCSILTDEADLDESEKYLEEARGPYLAALKDLRGWITENESEKSDDASSVKEDKKGSDIDPSEFMQYVNLPRIEIETFDGDPMSYHRFMTLFMEHVDRTKFDDASKLSRLLHYTKGDAKRAIEHCILSGSKGYQRALEILDRRFGDADKITQKILCELKNGKSVNSPKELQKFSDELRGGVEVLANLKRVGEIDTQSSIAEILNRLQPFVHTRWRKEVAKTKRHYGGYPDLGHFIDFIEELAEEQNDPIYGVDSVFRTKVQKEIKPKKTSSYGTSTSTAGSTGGSRGNSGGNSSNDSSNTIGGASGSTLVAGSGATSGGAEVKKKWVVKIPCVVCNEMHKVLYCDQFRKLSVKERIEVVKKHNLCEVCLLGNHSTENCRRTTTCGVSGCVKRHTRFIHVDEPSGGQDVKTAQLTQCKTALSSSTEIGAVMVPTVTVNVNGKEDVLALLDNASNTTFCTQRLVDSLGLKGKSVTYRLNTLSASNEIKDTNVVQLALTSNDGTKMLKVANVHVVKEIPVNMPQINVNGYEHLKGLVKHSSVIDQVDLLIGQDNAEALIPLEVKRGQKGEPFAVRTLFGWSINGPIDVAGVANHKVVSHFICSTELAKDLGKIWDIENGEHSDTAAWSLEDEGVIKLWEEKVRIDGGHYELPIPWKPGIVFPNNRCVALFRFQSLLKSLEKRQLVDRYGQEIQKLLDSGYAEPVPCSVSSGDRIWYLPHHAVVTPKKPDKVRVVFDCASKYQGESLNDKAFQGPDLTNKLVNVLLRFREHPIAIMADIEAMYHQVKIPSYDRDALRFLWIDGDRNIVEYRMTSHLFGGVWCASSSTYALRHVLVDNQVDSLIQQAIQNSFYVDDYLDSVQSVDAAKTLVFGTKDTLKVGGFNLTKFISSDQSVVESIPEMDRAKEVKEFNSDSQSKALGVHWDVTCDELYYKVDIVLDRPVTKRNMLSVVASVYDPLGLVSPVVVSGRLILQDVVRLKVDWDEKVETEEILTKWKQWTSGLVSHIHRFRFSRCITPVEVGRFTMELHHFCDASNVAFGTCAYLRCVTDTGQVHTTLIASKSRVSPLKPMTIPRMELQAAVLAAKLDKQLRTEMRLEIKTSHFWSDSQIVLAYLRNQTSRFQVFVANRVNLILSLTEASQWRHISGEENPADLITRVQNPATMNLDKWQFGPQFLREVTRDWPDCESEHDLSSDPEVKKVVNSHVIDVEKHPLEVLCRHYSKWRKLVRAVAIWRRPILIKRAMMQPDKKDLSLKEIKEAELVLVMHVQRQCYQDELVRLKSGSALLMSSPVRSLDPVLNKDGLLCVGGRLRHAELSDAEKHPVLIPHNHPVAKLIVREAHEISHLGTEWTLSFLRKKFWVTRARILLKQIKQQCVVCKKLYAMPMEQRMADLPVERLMANGSPFQFVGCDCFGPFYVKYGRAEIKRYGLLCTCLAVRAIHLEVLDDMSTDSFLMGFRRFNARRGSPDKVLCDNGTNFVGAQGEMDKCKQDLDFSKIQAFGVKSNIEWQFNPPYASHMGGVWERMIRTTRRVLVAVLKGARLTDDLLRTVFAEVEAIVNSRPLTKMSEDVDDISPLTPNHFLLLRGSVTPAPGVFTEADKYRRRWRYAQHLANQFWSRWVKEYLPSLQGRVKWQDSKENLKKGDIVLLLEENVPRRLWPLGLVLEATKGRDGLVRSVRVRTRSTTLVRPITKIVSLEAG